jgi:hypothetical protein
VLIWPKKESGTVAGLEVGRGVICELLLVYPWLGIIYLATFCVWKGRTLATRLGLRAIESGGRFRDFLRALGVRCLCFWVVVVVLVCGGFTCDGRLSCSAGSLFNCLCNRSCDLFIFLGASRDGGCGGLFICVFLALV